jgi:hypothetical protein
MAKRKEIKVVPPRKTLNTEITEVEVIADSVDYEGNNEVSIELGQWFWVKSSKEDKEKYLGCVIALGSNYAKLQEPIDTQHGTSSTRVLYTEILERLEPELNPQAVIRDRVQHYQALANQHLEQIKEITAVLGVSKQSALENKAAQGTALVTMSSAPDINQYKNALIKAKDTDLPKLFKEVKEANHQLARWMAAETLPMLALAGGMEDTIDTIKDRIFNVSLYAGLAEEIETVRKGEPAAFADKLYVMQRKLFMDEECLANYRHGGMEFKDIYQFDEWLSEEENFNRIFPSPRCLVAMQVRRKKKEREWDGTISGALDLIRLGASDKFTYLYIRNGEQLHRMTCELEFDQFIFPDASMFDPDEPMMAKVRMGGSVDQLMTVSEYEVRVAEYTREVEGHAQWILDNPFEEWDALQEWSAREQDDEKHRRYMWERANPFKTGGIWKGHINGFSPQEWSPFDKDNVYFDECMKTVTDRIKYYNRIAVIIQGLFDRSEILHPHPPVKTWTSEGFAAAVELVFDGSNVLTHGELPDFEAYRAKCNTSLTTGSMVVGQEIVWLKKEAEKENRRIDSDWRDRNKHHHTTFRPYGNPGPGYLAPIAHWSPRTRKATFEWTRERLRQANYWEKSEEINCKITVSGEHLFNVDAYKLGDYKQFFNDSRTREQYLKWAPMLMAAEEYHAKKMLGDKK